MNMLDYTATTEKERIGEIAFTLALATQRLHKKSINSSHIEIPANFAKNHKSPTSKHF